MSKLFVITFKRPSTNLEKAVYGQEFTHSYDCEATGIESVANSKVEEYKANPEYSDIDLFECEEFEYVEFCKMEDAYVHFAKTGEHSMKSIDEDVDVGTDSHTELIHLRLEMSRSDNSASFDYHVDIDDVGQIVFTPDDNNTSFTDMDRITENDLVDEVITENKKVFTVMLTADMIAENENFEWFYDIDEVGQAVITPEDENTSFLSVSLNNSLNLVTDEVPALTEAIDPSSQEYGVKKELCLELVKDLTAALELTAEKITAIQRALEEIGINARDFEDLIKILEKFYDGRDGDPSIEEITRRLNTYESSSTSIDEVLLTEEFVFEDLSDEERQKIIDRFMFQRDELTIVQADVAPSGDTIVRLSELDSRASDDAKYRGAEFYYDTESDVVICHNKVQE